ncbi:hypothetical protein WJX73_005917 [Symbiochloris irregularis]|uniref:proteasome endopeptidase complex n=1 Tax=Symbiochloris irregularis TaxID=706552 RepID=A0AAW1NJD3_9CHLO
MVGFDFDLCKRNAFLEERGVKGPLLTKTGTTIAGVIYKDGVVLGADTRSTAGNTVADKNCEKIHFIAPNIYCCGAGTAADTENVTGMISSQLELHRYGTGRQSRVITAMTLLKSHLFRYQGHVSAALVLGGVDLKGPHLFTVYPHGSTDSLPYATMGSGSLNAMAVFESGYEEDMSKDSAVALVARAIRSGIFNDLGSGSNVDICVITKDGVEYKRNYEYLQGKTYQRKKPVVYPRGTAAVVKERTIRLVDVDVLEGDATEAIDFRAGSRILEGEGSKLYEAMAARGLAGCYIVPIQKVRGVKAAHSTEFYEAAKRMERCWIRLLDSRDSGFNSYIPGGKDVPYSSYLEGFTGNVHTLWNCVRYLYSCRHPQVE